MNKYQPVEVNIISAKIDSLNLFFQPEVYVSGSVTCGSRDQHATPPAVCSDKLLRWNYAMKFYLQDDKVQKNESVFVFVIKVKKLLVFENVIGKVLVPVKHLRDLDQEKKRNMEYEVISKSGNRKGYISLGFKFGSAFDGSIRSFG